MNALSCWEFMRDIGDPKSNTRCDTCVKFNRSTKRCKDKESSVGAYEESVSFDISDLLMRTNRGVYIT